jgi:flagellar basal body-associated protein FliL
MRPDIPKPDSETNKGPMIAIILIVVLFILGYFGYMMFIPKQVEQMNKTENIKPVEQTVKDSI